ncbi:hypothetical protein BWI96_09700 [Siphonobacter sp. SORGH_AS_0500]|nr:hypothetical protein BWI96_09700 [Siphonobacter sp. SORGH_AS_0500]
MKRNRSESPTITFSFSQEIKTNNKLPRARIRFIVIELLQERQAEDTGESQKVGKRNYFFQKILLLKIVKAPKRKNRALLRLCFLFLRFITFTLIQQ